MPSENPDPSKESLLSKQITNSPIVAFIRKFLGMDTKSKQVEITPEPKEKNFDFQLDYFNFKISFLPQDDNSDMLDCSLVLSTEDQNLNGRGILAVCDQNYRVEKMIQNELKNLNEDPWEYEFGIKDSEVLRVFFITPSLTPGSFKINILKINGSNVQIEESIDNAFPENGSDFTPADINFLKPQS